MSSNALYRFSTLAAIDYCDVVADGTHDSPKKAKEGKLLVTSKNIKNNNLTLEGAYLISRTDYEQINKRSKVDLNDILISMIGTIGSVCRIEVEPNFAIKNVGLLKVTSEVKSKWLYYYLISPDTQRLIDSRTKGSTQQYLSLTELRNFPIKYPEEASIAEKAVEILDKLTNKIALNQQMNKTLEEMAQAIFKCWFVNFEPTRAKMAGESEASICKRLNLTPDILALFPATLTNSDLGPIPEGWTAGPLLKTANVWSGGTPKTKVDEYWNGDIPWFSVVDAPKSGDVFVIQTDKHITEAGVSNSATKILPTGTTIVSARGTVGKLAVTGVPMAMNQSCYGLEAKEKIGPYFNYLNLIRLVQEMKDMAHGSVFDTITRSTLESIDITIPADEIILEFHKLVEPLFDKIKSNLFEIKNLTETRDALLPKLLSGELSVDNIEL